MIFGKTGKGVVPSVEECFSEALVPHELVEIRCQQREFRSVHALEFSLAPLPIIFDIIGVDPGRWVHKIVFVNNDTVVKS